jgi:glycosyltransferase involved in cell wall biosynthesis
MSSTDGRPLVVGIDARLRSGEVGGVEQYVVGLASGLGQLSDGNERYLFLVEPGDEGWLLPHLRGSCEVVYTVGWPRLRGMAVRARRRLVAAAPWLKRLRRAVGSPSPVGPEPPISSGHLEMAGAQLIHFPLQSAFLTDLPSLYQPWDLQHLHLPEFFTPEAIAFRETRYRAFCARAARVIVATSYARHDLMDRYGLDPGKIVVVPAPPPISVYPPPTPADLERSASRLHLPRDFLFYPAQTWPHKNHLRLLRAIALLRDRDALAIQLVCSGRLSEHFGAIRDAVNELGLTRQVRFLGYVSPTELHALYRLGRALIFPSLFEGWGFPVVEAFWVGQPVACARVTSLPDLVDDAALLFDPTDVEEIAGSIARIWNDAPLRHDLVARGRDRIQGLEWTRVARVARAHYRAVAGRRLDAEDAALVGGSAP